MNHLKINYNAIAKHIVSWLSDYANKTKVNGFVIGISGGIDSAVVVAMACKALGAENVKAVLMPFISLFFKIVSVTFFSNSNKALRQVSECEP